MWGANNSFAFKLNSDKFKTNDISAEESTTQKDGCESEELKLLSQNLYELEFSKFFTQFSKNNEIPQSETPPKILIQPPNV